MKYSLIKNCTDYPNNKLVTLWNDIDDIEVILSGFGNCI
jgi:hypothetical protein